MADYPDAGNGCVPGFGLMYQDSHLLILEKPSGLLCVPGRGVGKQDCLSARVQARYPDALIVHRLDQATSGLVVMARGIEIQRQLSAAFATRQVVKHYRARVRGDTRYASSWQTIDLAIGQHWPDRPRRHIATQGGQPSVTRWRCIGFDQEGCSSLVELEPLTGRTHQLRVHLMAAGHPILGDALYAPPDALAAADRLLLHACSLEFVHPATGEPMAFHSVCPF